MMTKERFQELRKLTMQFDGGDEQDYLEATIGATAELLDEVERLQAELGRQTTYVHELEEAMDTDRLLKIQTAQRRNFVPHVGPPDTTPCVQVPMADARDGGL